MGSRASPDSSSEKTVDEGLPLVTEGKSPTEHLTCESGHRLSNEDLRLQREGEQALEALEALTENDADWTFEKSKDGIYCYSRPGKTRKIFKAEGVYDLTVEELWNLLYPGDTTPEWSPQCALNEVIYRVDEHTDIVYSVTNTMGPIASRDFVSVRQFKFKDGCYYSASVATTSKLKPHQSWKVRAENGPSGYVLVPVDERKAKFTWVINADLKGWLPQLIIDHTIAGALIGSFQGLHHYIGLHTSKRM